MMGFPVRWWMLREKATSKSPSSCVAMTGKYLAEHDRVQLRAGGGERILRARHLARNLRPRDEAKVHELRSLSLSTFVEMPGMNRSSCPGRDTPRPMAASTAADHLQPTTSSNRRYAVRSASGKCPGFLVTAGLDFMRVCIISAAMQLAGTKRCLPTQ